MEAGGERRELAIGGLKARDDQVFRALGRGGQAAARLGEAHAGIPMAHASLELLEQAAPLGEMVAEHVAGAAFEVIDALARAAEPALERSGGAVNPHLVNAGLAAREGEVDDALEALAALRELIE